MPTTHAQTDPAALQAWLADLLNDSILQEFNDPIGHSIHSATTGAGNSVSLRLADGTRFRIDITQTNRRRTH